MSEYAPAEKLAMAYSLEICLRLKFFAYDLAGLCCCVLREDSYYNHSRALSIQEYKREPGTQRSNFYTWVNFVKARYHDLRLSHPSCLTGLVVNQAIQ